MTLDFYLGCFSRGVSIMSGRVNFHISCSCLLVTFGNNSEYQKHMANFDKKQDVWGWNSGVPGQQHSLHMNWENNRVICQFMALTLIYLNSWTSLLWSEHLKHSWTYHQYCFSKWLLAALGWKMTKISFQFISHFNGHSLASSRKYCICSYVATKTNKVYVNTQWVNSRTILNLHYAAGLFIKC